MESVKFIVALFVAVSYVSAFKSFIQYRSFSTAIFSEVDPNFEAHLPTLLKAGSADRSDPDIGESLRKRFKQIESSKRRAATSLKSSDNAALVEELEDLADELSETHEKFVQLAETWNAWSRPSPDLPKELREKAVSMTDPNFDDHLAEFLKRGKLERPDYELPSDLRMMKYKNMVEVKKIAAKELKKAAGSENIALAEELEDMALEMQEAQEQFEMMAKTFRSAMDRSESSVSNR